MEQCKYNDFTTLIYSNEREAANAAATMLLQQITSKPDSVLGLATGSTQELVYKQLVSGSTEEHITWRGVKTYNLDEYVGVSPAHSASYSAYMQKHFFGNDSIDIPNQSAYIPNGIASDLDVECLRYDALIHTVGGADMQLLGIGRNCHIGFNEPGSTRESKVRVVDLKPSTIEANREHCIDIDVPRQAITMGIDTILQGKQFLLLATTATKADAIYTLLKTKESPMMCPAAYLKEVARNVTILLTHDSAVQL